MPLDKGAQHLHRNMGGDVRGIALDAEPVDLPGFTKTSGEQACIGLLAERFEQPVAPFEHAWRTFVTTLRQPRSDHAALGGAPEMQALDHTAGAGLRKSQQSASERAGNAEGVGGLRRRQPQQRSAGSCRAEWTGHARSVKADLLGRVQRRRTDAEHHFDAGYNRGDEIAAAGTAGLRHRESWQRHSGAAMHAGAGLAQVVELEGMRKGAERQRRLRDVETLTDDAREPARSSTPLATASSSTIADQGNRWPKTAQAIASIRQCLARATTDSGKSSNVNATANSANC